MWLSQACRGKSDHPQQLRASESLQRQQEDCSGQLWKFKGPTKSVDSSTCRFQYLQGVPGTELSLILQAYSILHVRNLVKLGLCLFRLLHLDNCYVFLYIHNKKSGGGRLKYLFHVFMHSMSSFSLG